jgi:hypothetical protein
MKRIPVCIGILITSLIAAHPAAGAPPLQAPAQSVQSADHQAIEALLAAYPRCLTNDDEAGFRALLLDDNIPFAMVKTSAAGEGPLDLRHYEDFRKAVFLSGQRYKQRFYNIRIEQHGPLAQATLNFVTERVSGKPDSVTGWKVLQLVKVGGNWKIASELYTFEI